MESSTQRSYPPQQHLDGSLDDSTEYSRTRDPLADATGNRQNQEAFGSNGPSHYDIKANQHRDPPQHVLPSQPSRQTLGNTLELRRQGLRRHRSNRLGSLNPIVNSPQYIAYRNRQAREGNELDAKWPAMLEEAFLEGNDHLCLHASDV
jgi:transcriptional enhancer factor